MSKGKQEYIKVHKSYIKVDESWEARFCVRVFSTLISWSNENKSYAIRIEKQEMYENFLNFSQTRIKVGWLSKLVEVMNNKNK